MSGKPELETSKGLESMDEEEISAAPLNSTFNSEDTQVATITYTSGYAPKMPLRTLERKGGESTLYFQFFKKKGEKNIFF